MILQSRGAAWLVTAIAMVIGIFAGSHITYRQMRAPVLAAYREDIVPLLQEGLQLIDNVITIYELNVPDTSESRSEVAWFREEALRWLDNIEDVRGVELWWTMVARGRGIYARASELELSENDARRMRNMIIDLDETQMILRQQFHYNELATNFGDASRSGLWIFTRGWTWFPVFD